MILLFKVSSFALRNTQNNNNNDRSTTRYTVDCYVDTNGLDSAEVAVAPTVLPANLDLVVVPSRVARMRYVRFTMLGFKGASGGLGYFRAIKPGETVPAHVCAAGSPSGCAAVPVDLLGEFSAANLLRVWGGRRVDQITDQNSCPAGWKIFAPQARQDWATFCASAYDSCQGELVLTDIAKRTSGGGFTSYAMNSGIPGMSEWKASDGSPWWLRDTRYSRPSGDYTANCFLATYPRGSNLASMEFNDASCSYSSSGYFCSPALAMPAWGRYVRIGWLTGDRVLNLAEVRAFSSTHALQPMKATLSSEHTTSNSESQAASKCVTRSDDLSCHTKMGRSDPDPSLLIDFGRVVNISAIVVTNRDGAFAARIDGAAIRVTADEAGKKVVWSATFKSAKAEYVFGQPPDGWRTLSKALPPGLAWASQCDSLPADRIVAAADGATWTQFRWSAMYSRAECEAYGVQNNIGISSGTALPQDVLIYSRTVRPRQTSVNNSGWYQGREKHCNLTRDQCPDGFLNTGGDQVGAPLTSLSAPVRLSTLTIGMWPPILPVVVVKGAYADRVVHHCGLANLFCFAMHH